MNMLSARNGRLDGLKRAALRRARIIKPGCGAVLDMKFGGRPYVLLIADGLIVVSDCGCRILSTHQRPS